MKLALPATLFAAVVAACTPVETIIAQQEVFCEQVGHRNTTELRDIARVQCVEYGTRGQIAQQRALPSGIITGVANAAIIGAAGAI